MPRDYTQEAKKTLQILVGRILKRNAETDTYKTLSITYKDLAERIGFEEPHSGNGFSAKISEMLGMLGNMLNAVGKNKGIKVPQIQALVVNQATGIPGEGIDGYIPGYSASDESGRKALVQQEYEAIINFGNDWNMVVEEIGTMFQ